MKHFSEFIYHSHKAYKAGKKSPFKWISDDILTLDIEVTSAFIENGKVIGYEPGKDEAYWNSLIPVSLPYIWQFSYDDEVYYGREFTDFIKVLEQLPTDTKFVIWVHNLSYEFQFLCNLLKWREVFARDAHKVMKAVPEDFPNVEFRCSYFLTRLSLETWGEQVGLNKLVGYLDYTKIRTPLTELTDDEMAYAQRDCEVVYKGIQTYLKRYKHIANIPLTQTGEVRRALRKVVQEDNEVQHHMVSLIPDVKLYSILHKVFQGGYTHANYTLSGRVIHGGVAFDFASSYPAVMLSEKMPYTPFKRDTLDVTKTKEKAYLIKAEFTGLKAKTRNHYLSYAKCEEVKGAETDNGRIISADKAVIWITEIDLQIIQKTYTAQMKVLECYSSNKEYLPKCIIEFILDLYEKKTELKGVKGQEEIYMQKKQFINSVYGMTVTNILFDDIIYDGNGGWSTAFKSMQDIQDALTEMKTNNRGRTFLAYQFGPWITAYARKNLWDCLIPYDKDVIYCDTDSLKIRGYKADFKWYDDIIDGKLKAMCEHYGIDFNRTRPKDKKGKEHPLGRFERESDFTEFKTLGAKRYVYRSAEDGQLHLTVSGINKGAVECLHDDIEEFTETTCFDKDAEGVKKQHTVYINDQGTIIFPDGFKSSYRYGINLRPTGYTMSLTDDYVELIGLLSDKTLAAMG